MAQSQVYTSIAPGVPGQKATLNPAVYLPHTPLADGEVVIGTFVWVGTDPTIQAKNTGTGAPLGFVERNIVYPNYDVTAEGSLVAHDGATLTVATKGDFWAVAGAAAVVGNKVFAKTADGTLLFGAAGATVSGGVETQFKVDAVYSAGSSAAAGDIVLISTASA